VIYHVMEFHTLEISIDQTNRLSTIVLSYKKIVQ